MKKNKLMILVSVLVFLSLTPFTSIAKKANETKICPAEKGTELPLLAKKDFEIESYDKATKSYNAFSVEFPDESTMEVTLEALADAVPKIKKDFDLILNNPEDIVGARFTPTKNMQVLSEDELEARRGCVRN